MYLFGESTFTTRIEVGGLSGLEKGQSTVPLGLAGNSRSFEGVVGLKRGQVRGARIDLGLAFSQPVKSRRRNHGTTTRYCP